MKHMIFLVIIALLLPNICNAQEFERKFQTTLDSTYRANNEAVGIMIHVESPNKNISWTYAVGFSDKSTEQKINKNQPLLIASNTKTYVSATILKLAENGELRLNQPIKKIIHKLFEGKIIKDKNILSQIHTYVIPKEESKNYCLGLYNFPSFFGNKAYYHGGWWGTDVMYLPKLNTTISVFTLLKEKRGLNAEISREIIKLLNQ